MKWLRRTALGLLLLLLLLGAVLGVYATRALPQTEGQLQLPLLRAELRIERDRHGIPSIHAQSEADLAFGMGVVHAQDRLWQMELQRRIGAGRLAEALGPAALQSDRFLRVLGVRRAAQQQWQNMPAPARELLQAYTDGVNAVLGSALRARPPEFVLLGLRPEPWTPVDSLSWALMMAWDLGGNFNNELLRLRLALQLPVHRIEQMLPPYPGESPLPVADYAALYRGLLGGDAPALQSWGGRIEQLAAAAPPSGIEGTGSNVWVLAGSRTQGGKPLLANDPHLRLGVPSLWYFVRLHAPGLRVAGASLPGLPGVVLGANEHLAWGYTNTGPDVQDLYLEQVDPADPGRYRTPEGWAGFETTNELIRVKGQPDVQITVRRTRHGPVVSDAIEDDKLLGETPPGARPGYVLALRWTALEPDHDAITASAALQRARSVQEFFEAVRGWSAPMQNMAVADREGRIGMISPGRIPLRGPGHDLMGLVPAPGWEARYDWQGWLPFELLPQQLDPPQGLLANANQRVTAPDYPHFLGSEWAWPWRQQRIEQQLQAQAQAKHGNQDMAALQMDEHSLAARALLPWLQQARSPHALAGAAQARLQGFEGHMAAASAAPLIYWAWLRNLAEGIFADEVPAALWERQLAGRSFVDALSLILPGADNSWCDDRRTPEPETCAMQADKALTAALDELQAAYGADLARWRWGQAHQALGEHRPFSRVPLLAELFEQRVPLGGDSHTVNASRVLLRPAPRDGQRYASDHGPSLRAIYDLGDPAQSRFMHSSGQSGIVFSPLYRSFVEPWRRGQFLPLWGELEERRQVLVLQPLR